MKLTIMGASGLIGTKVVALLTTQGHEVVAASRATGVDVLTGEGLADAMADADVLVDVTNSPSFEDGPVMDFFTTSTSQPDRARPRRPVSDTTSRCRSSASTVCPKSGYMRAKLAQERLVTASGLPYSIVRATQFAEFAEAIIGSMTDGDTVRVPDALDPADRRE